MSFIAKIIFSNAFLASELKKANSLIQKLEIKNRELESDYLRVSNENNLKSKLISKISNELNSKETIYHKLSEKFSHLVGKLDKAIARLKSNSSNSSRPSSTDCSRYSSTNNRTKSKLKVGGQPNHKGVSMKLQVPDKIIENKDESCNICGGELIFNEIYKAKQKIDIEFNKLVYEYRFFTGTCIACGNVQESGITIKSDTPVTYDDNLKALVVMLRTQGYMSYSRIQGFLNDITNNNLHLSQGSLYNFVKEVDTKSGDTYNKIRENIVNADVLNVDETTVSVNGTKQYAHTHATSTLTYIVGHANRGIMAVEAIGMLSKFAGTLVHDHFTMYYRYGSFNAECNAHILRYLNRIDSFEKYPWAIKMKDFLILALNVKYASISFGHKTLDEKILSVISNQYDLIINEGYNEFNLGLKRSKFYDEESMRLLNRLRKYKDNHLLFLYNFNVPFTNNIAERSFRNLKVFYRVIGTSRSELGKQANLTQQSIYQTCKKNNISYFQTIKQLLANNISELDKILI